MRIGDRTAHDAHHVRLARRNHGVGVLRRADVAFGLDAGVADGSFQRFGKRRAQLVRVDEGRHQLVEVEVAAGAAGDIIDEAALVVPGDDLGQGFQRQRHADIGIAADRHADDEVVAGALANACDDLAGKTHPVLQAAAPAIVAAIRPGCPELVDEGMVGGEQLDTVESGGLGPARGPGEAFDDLLDLRLAHGVAAVGIVVGGQAGRRPGRLEGIVEVAVRPHVIDLVNHHAAVCVAGIGDAAEMRDHRIVPVAEVAAGENAGGVNGDRLAHDHRRPAPGTFAVVPQVAFARQPVFGHVGRVGAEIEPVAKCFVAQAQGLEKMGEQLRHDGVWRRAFLQPRLILDNTCKLLIRSTIKVFLDVDYHLGSARSQRAFTKSRRETLHGAGKALSPGCPSH